MNHNTKSHNRFSTSLGLMAGTLLLIAPTAAFSMDPCEELRRDCMDYCRYQNPMLDHRDCKRECRDRVRKCRGGGMGMGGPMGYPGGFGRSEKAEPDFRGMPEVGVYRGGGPGYGYGAPPAGGYGYPGAGYPQPGYPAGGAPPQTQTAPPAPAQPPVPQQGRSATAPAPSTQPPAQPAAPQYPGGGYPPAGAYGGYPGGRYGPYGHPGYGRPPYY